MSPEERAQGIVEAEHLWNPWIERFGLRNLNHERLAELIALAIRAAMAAERERCAQVAEGWCDPDALGHFRPTLEFPRMTGCYTSFSEGMECTAPAGIAAAIRAISGAKQ